MDAKLKALKVVDLKAILAKAQVSAPAKATKNDLITRIQASKDALAAYAALYPQDDLLAPPEEVDWNVDQLDSPASPPKINPAPSISVPKPATTPVPPAAAPVSPPSAAAPVDPAVADAELDKRRQRAARFGIPLVEQSQKKTREPRAPAATKPAAALAADPKKLEERAARFGIKPEEKPPAPAPNGKKRPAPSTQEVDPEELERRKKRAERFGLANIDKA